jgi:hypothetical protein
MSSSVAVEVGDREADGLAAGHGRLGFQRRAASSVARCGRIAAAGAGRVAARRSTAERTRCDHVHDRDDCGSSKQTLHDRIVLRNMFYDMRDVRGFGP